MKTEFHGKRVLVTGGNSSIAPGVIATPINQDMWQKPAGLKDLLTKGPMARIGKPENIAGVAVALASGVASYIAETTVFVDRGMTDHPDFMHGG